MRATARKASGSAMAWSEGQTSIRPSGSVSASFSAAASTAGALLRPSGSISTEPAALPMPASCSVTMKRNSDPVTTMGLANSGSGRRLTEAWNRLSEPSSRPNCLG